MKKETFAVLLHWKDAESLTDHLRKHLALTDYSIKSGSGPTYNDVVFKRTIEVYDIPGGHKERLLRSWCEKFQKAKEKQLGYCPFCGGVPEIMHRKMPEGNISYAVAYVQCSECGCKTPEVIIDGYYGAKTTEKDAIDKWNRRA